MNRGVRTKVSHSEFGSRIRGGEGMLRPAAEAQWATAAAFSMRLRETRLRKIQ